MLSVCLFASVQLPPFLSDLETFKSISDRVHSHRTKGNTKAYFFFELRRCLMLKANLTSLEFIYKRRLVRIRAVISVYTPHPFCSHYLPTVFVDKFVAASFPSASS